LSLTSKLNLLKGNTLNTIRYKALLIIALILITTNNTVLAQAGGRYVYEFMNLSNSARVSAFGSNFATIDDNDIDLAYSNPSLITNEMHHQISLNYLGYFAGTKAGFISFGHNIKKLGTFVGSLQFINYGTFDATDNTGQETGTFNASEYNFVIGWSKPLSDNLRLGVNIKNILSNLESYHSYGIAADVALNYSNDNKLLSSSLIFKNMGRQISTYTGSDNEPLHFNIQFGIAKKFEHAPFRLLFLFNNLQKWDLKYSDPSHEGEVDPFTGEVKTSSKAWDITDNTLRHIILGVEFIPGKGKFMVRFGYNYRRQQEMKIANRSGLVGFSFGVGLKVYKFKIGYSRTSYHLSGGTNTISIGTNLDSFFQNNNNK